ncbi:MAG: PEGA domain-containing protein [bacterium]
MYKRQSRTRALIFFLTVVFIVIGTYLTIRYAQGYRPTKQGTIKGTGLLNANSFPNGAEVYINGRLSTATDTTLNLEPGEYTIELKKDGYHSWKKTLKLESELVVQTNAQLFPTSPTLSPLTYTGALNPISSPDGNQVAFAVASASASTKNGLYVQDLSTGTLNLGKSARQIARSSQEYDYTKANYTYSPNGSEILVSFASGSHVLLETNQMNDIASLKDVTIRLPTILRDWEEELARKSLTDLLKLPDFILNMATSSATNVYSSPDGDKLLYQATKEIDIPEGLIPQVIAKNTQPETRHLIPGSFYVYDLKEDTNYLVYTAPLPSPSPTPSAKPKIKNSKAPLINVANSEFAISKLLLLDNLDPITAELGSSPSAFHHLQNNFTITQSLSLFNAQYSPINHLPLQWYPDSNHLIITTDNGIDIMGYDTTNRATVYAGPFDRSFVYIWPDASRLVTRIQFSPETTPNLYVIKLK